MTGAIETVYAGHRFRSRLEARWAVFFDTAGIDWKYEAQGYEVDGARYLPDFELSEDGVYVEVKGERNALGDDFPRMSKVLGSQSPLPGFAEGKTSLVLLGDIARDAAGAILHPVLQRIDGSLVRTWGAFVRTDRIRFLTMKPHALMGLLGHPVIKNVDKDAGSIGWLPDSQAIPTPGNWPEVRRAYEAARFARFEHGETGR